MSQLDLFGEPDVMDAVRHVIEVNGLAEVGEAIRMDEGDLIHAMKRTRRRGGSLKCVIGADKLIALTKLPGGDAIARAFAAAAGGLWTPGRAATPEETLRASELAVEECLGGEARKGYLRARARHEEQLVAKAQLAKGAK